MKITETAGFGNGSDPSGGAALGSTLAVANGARPRSSAARGPSIRGVVLVLQSVALGGMETHVRYLARELVRRAIAVTVVIPESSNFDELAGIVRSEGSDVVRLDTDARRGRGRQIRAAIRLVRLLRHRRADALHLHTGGATGGLFVAAAARLASRATVVVTEHDVPSQRPAAWDRATRTAMDRFLHCLVAVSRRNASLRRDRQGVRCRNYAAILNGVPIAQHAPDVAVLNRHGVRDELGIGKDAVVLGSLVRLAEGKGLRDLLQAFARVGDPRAQLLLVGDGPLRPELEAIATELGVADRVRFAGHQRQPTRYLDAMDAFVLAVPAGSMSIALLEAMAHGLPSVITFCGPEEAVVDGDTGLCAPPEDPDGLALALRSLTQDPDLRLRLGRNGAAYVRARFSSERVADDLLAVYNLRNTGSIPSQLIA